jgi:hypothetical protein
VHNNQLWRQWPLTSNLTLTNGRLGSFKGGLFTHAIANTLNSDECRDIDTERNLPVYSAQGDAWSAPQQALTGFGRSQYQDRYDALPVVPAKSTVGTSDRKHGSRRQPPTNIAGPLFEELTSTYYSINTGRESIASNTGSRFSRAKSRTAIHVR